MATTDRLSPLASARKFFAPLALALLLVGALAVNAQENANGANANAGSTNANTNRNVNAGANANGNLNQNAPGNGNSNVNANQRGGGATLTPSPTPSPSPTPDLSAEARKHKLVDSYWFYPLICLMFLGVLFPFAYAIYRSIKYSRGTYGPLGLPEGSLRAMLAYMLVAFLGFYVLASVLSLSEFKPSDFLLGVVATVIGFYFGSRAGEDKSAGAKRAGAVVAVEVKDAGGAPVEGATVELTHSDGKKFSKKTGADGTYKFENVPSGDYTVEAKKTGYNPSDPTQVRVEPGETETVKLKLN